MGEKTSKLNFKDWFYNEIAGATGAIYDGSGGDFNWEGAPGGTGTVSAKGDPIGVKKKKKKK